MIYPLMTLPDETEIVHSELRDDGTVCVYVEKPDAEDCFHSAQCILPGYKWENVMGFSEKELSEYTEMIESMAHLIFEFSKEGGFENAAGF